VTVRRLPLVLAPDSTAAPDAHADAAVGAFADANRLDTAP
jgi:hypothetical protein